MRLRHRVKLVELLYKWQGVLIVKYVRHHEEKLKLQELEYD